jgi:hypothetical protein
VGRKANFIGHILKINYLLHDVIKGEMTEVKSVEKKKKKNTGP